jgi:NADH dehydrogenase
MAVNKHRVVIVGGGVAGLDLARQLGRQRRKNRRLGVTFVDRELAHVWKPMLHTLAAGMQDAVVQAGGTLGQGRGCRQYSALSGQRRGGFYPRGDLAG